MSRAIMSTIGTLLLAALLLPNACAAEGDRGERGNRGGGRWPDKLNEGDEAPDFELQSPDGKTTFKLSEHKGLRPVVLVFGSYT